MNEFLEASVGASDEQGLVDVGTFPLHGNALVDGLPLSTKFLHLFCEELAKAKFDQTSRSKSYFPPRAPVPPTVGSMVP